VSAQLQAPAALTSKVDSPAPSGHEAGRAPEPLRKKLLTLRRLKPRPLCCPARSQSLFRMCYPGSWECTHSKYMCILVYVSVVYSETAVSVGAIQYQVT
jgi:hypothetical protein